jgi:NAD(P)H-hydrate epimerase
MYKAISAQQMKQIDQRAINEFGIPSIVLMENAGRSVAEAAIDILEDTGKKVICVCGKGNNGGDGFVCARHLVNRGAKVKIFLIGSPDELKGDAKINFSILQKMKADICLLKKEDILNFQQEIKRADLIIDAIFGIGLSGKVREPYAKIITTINANAKPVIAVDIPSGLNADSGEVLGVCIKAAKTITFAAAKIGCLKAQGPEVCGQLIVADISIPEQLV